MHGIQHETIDSYGNINHSFTTNGNGWIKWLIFLKKIIVVYRVYVWLCGKCISYHTTRSKNGVGLLPLSISFQHQLDWKCWTNIRGMAPPLASSGPLFFQDCSLFCTLKIIKSKSMLFNCHVHMSNRFMCIHDYNKDFRLGWKI